MINYFTPQIIVLAITGLVNLAMSIFIFNRGQKNKINLYFSALTFLAFMWAIVQLFAILAVDLNWLSFWDRSTYLFGLAVMICLLYFIINFPYQSDNLTTFEKILVWVPAIFLALIIYTNFFISSHLMLGFQQYRSYFYGSAYILYMVYFIVLAYLCLIRLGRKYKNVDLIFKSQIKSLAIIFFVCIVFGFYVDLWLLYLGNFSFVWVAPLPTLIMNAMVFFFIISPKEKIND